MGSLYCCTFMVFTAMFQRVDEYRRILTNTDEYCLLLLQVSERLQPTGAKIVAPAQGGTHYNGRKTFGHSLILSPDGKIIKEQNNKKEGVITALIDPQLPKKLRVIIPSLKSD